MQEPTQVSLLWEVIAYLIRSRRDCYLLYSLSALLVDVSLSVICPCVKLPLLMKLLVPSPAAIRINEVNVS